MARDLSMTVDELREKLTTRELYQWAGFMKLEAERAKRSQGK